jgi:hypothetical protein
MRRSRRTLSGAATLMDALGVPRTLRQSRLWHSGTEMYARISNWGVKVKTQLDSNGWVPGEGSGSNIGLFGLNGWLLHKRKRGWSADPGSWWSLEGWPGDAFEDIGSADL